MQVSYTYADPVDTDELPAAAAPTAPAAPAAPAATPPAPDAVATQARLQAALALFAQLEECPDSEGDFYPTRALAVRRYLPTDDEEGDQVLIEWEGYPLKHASFRSAAAFAQEMKGEDIVQDVWRLLRDLKASGAYAQVHVLCVCSAALRKNTDMSSCTSLSLSHTSSAMRQQSAADSRQVAGGQIRKATQSGNSTV